MGFCEVIEPVNAACHGSHDITAIDAKTGDVVGTVNAEGDGEEAVIGADGMIYVNNENTNEVVVFDRGKNPGQRENDGV